MTSPCTGVPGEVESVAEHSHRTSLLAFLIAAAERADPDRAGTLGAWHDVPETRIGDIPHLGHQYLTATDSTAIVTEQTEGLPATVATVTPQLIEQAQRELTGWDLACWCPLDVPCHADVWIKLLSPQAHPDSATRRCALVRGV